MGDDLNSFMLLFFDEKGGFYFLKGTNTSEDTVNSDIACSILCTERFSLAPVTFFYKYSTVLCFHSSIEIF